MAKGRPEEEKRQKIGSRRGHVAVWLAVLVCILFILMIVITRKGAHNRNSTGRNPVFCFFL